ncbi:MAG: gliding motility protein GldM [Paludibacteraceae bacterium]
MGGAKNCPETPRQKMIGMMYLVLTAMLALNVSTDILNGFKLVDDSLHSSLEATERRSQVLMDDFKALNDMNPGKNQEWYDKAVELTQKSDSLFDYIKDFKYQIALLADGKKADPEAREIEGNSNLDVTWQYAGDKKDGNGGNGIILKQKLDEYRNYLIELSGGTKKDEFEKIFATNPGVNHDGNPIPWENTIFEGMPVGASVTILTKLQNDIRSAESEMIQYIKGQTDASDFRVNKLEAFVIPNSKYVIRGSKYSAQIVLAAVDSTQVPAYYINAQRINDEGIYEVLATGLGARQYTGEIVLPKNDGSSLRIPFAGDYSVGEPSVTISNTDLNIMYRDYENKFSISVPGVSNDKVKVNVTGASASQRGGMWIIKPNSGREVTISVQAQLEEGHWQPMGSQTYRVKELPKPGAYFKSGATEYQEGKITRSALLNKDATVIASYGPDGLLDLKYTITSFQLQTSMGYSQSNSNKFTPQQISQLSKLKQGAVVNIVDIRAQGPEGKVVRLRGIPLTLN